MEMNIKADKAALDSKVNVSTFDNTFNMLDEGLREALQKMDDYMNEEMALKHALKQLSLDMSEKMDGQAFQALKNYLGRCQILGKCERVAISGIETFLKLHARLASAVRALHIIVTGRSGLFSRTRPSTLSSQPLSFGLKQSSLGVCTLK